MDGDFSHHPRYISDFFMAIKHCDVVIGSRMIFGGRERGRSAACRIITKKANLYIPIIFHTKIKDCTSGFLCFRREVVRVPFKQMISQWPSSVGKVFYYCLQQGFLIKEIPILFEDRRREKSKLNLRIF